MDSQGSKATKTGNLLEKFIFNILKEKGYLQVDKKKFNALKYLEQAIFTVQFPLTGIYDMPVYCDFVLYHPEKHKECIIIEAKWQQSSGSVDEKFPYLVANIKEKYPYATIILLDGSGYRKGSENWLRKQIDGQKLMKVMNMAEFQKWVNNGGL